MSRRIQTVIRFLSGIVPLTRYYTNVVAKMQHLFIVKKIGIFTYLTEYNPKKTVMILIVDKMKPGSKFYLISLQVDIFIPYFSAQSNAFGFISDL